MMARFTSGAEYCGYCTATCLKPSSASVALPDRMYCTARSKSARAAGVTSGCTAEGAPGVSAVVPAAAFDLPGAAADEAGGSAGALLRWGVELQAPSWASTRAPSARVRYRRAIARADGAPSPAGLRPRTGGQAGTCSLQARDHIVCQLRLTVACGLELGERLEALAHPLIVDPILGACCIELVRLDRLLLEREDLLLEE